MDNHDLYNQPRGKCIRFLEMTEDPNTIQSGIVGTILYVDDAGIYNSNLQPLMGQFNLAKCGQVQRVSNPGDKVLVNTIL